MKSDPKERKRLLAYFKHRPNTLVSIMKDCFKARKGNQGKKSNDATLEYQSTLNSSEQDIQKVFKLVNNSKSNSIENLSAE